KVSAGSTSVSGTRGFRPRRAASVGTPRGPTKRSHAPRKPAGAQRSPSWEYIDIPSVSTDFLRIVQEDSYLSEFPKGIGFSRALAGPTPVGPPEGGPHVKGEPPVKGGPPVQSTGALQSSEDV